jgi:hypothetical protein
MWEHMTWLDFDHCALILAALVVICSIVEGYRSSK